MIVADVDLIAKFRDVGLKNSYKLNKTGRFLQITGRTLSVFGNGFFCMKKIG